MGDQELLAKAAAVARHFGVQGDAREIAETRERFRLEGKWNESRTGRDHLEAELLGDPIGERRGTDLRNRQAAGRNDER